ncbi:MAG: hypothetical protein KGM93_16670 [Sphingomonadales bacterium]|nr:hypothetical protein [Sphingomonadales bacterium]
MAQASQEPRFVAADTVPEAGEGRKSCQKSRISAALGKKRNKFAKTR